MKRFFSFLLFILLSFSSLHAEVRLLSFDNFSLANAQEDGMLSSLQGEVVQVRGFWYPFSENEGILAAYPQLKSCCVRSPAKIDQQLIVKGVALDQLPSQRALTLEGTFKIQPAYNAKGELVQLFVLEQAHEVSQGHWHITSRILLALCAFFTIWLLIRNFKHGQGKR